MARKRPEYFNALQERLGMIGDFGSNQTTWERINKTRQDENKSRDEQLAWQQAQVDAARRGAQSQAGIAGNIRQGAVSNSPIGYAATNGGSAFDQFVNSISQKESGGNYGAVNRDSGAMGRYQIMPSNISGSGRGWDYEALGHDISTQQFMNSPELQDKIARYKLQQYYDKYGPSGASIAWYAGPGAANRYQQTGYASAAKQGNYPSISSYMNAINKNLL